MGTCQTGNKHKAEESSAVITMKRLSTPSLENATERTWQDISAMRLFGLPLRWS
jgi:hypothetical protein